MADTPLSEKTGRAILEELRAMRRNQEAQMPSGVAKQARMNRLPQSDSSDGAADPQSRVDNKLANLKTKGG